MDLNERLIQCRKDKEAIEAEEKKLLAEINKPKTLNFGDIVNCKNGDRVMLYDCDGSLNAYSKNGEDVGGNNPGFYTKIDNIFEPDNLLELDD